MFFEKVNTYQGVIRHFFHFYNHVNHYSPDYFGSSDIFSISNVCTAVLFLIFKILISIYFKITNIAGNNHIQLV